MTDEELKEAIEYAKAIVEAPSRSMAKRLAVMREDALARACLKLHKDNDRMAKAILAASLERDKQENRHLEYFRETHAAIDALKAKLARAGGALERVSCFLDEDFFENWELALDEANQALAVLDLNTIEPKKDTT
jgi:hypothetical protein